MYYVYVLYSKKLEKRYVGSTENVERRIDEHNRGKNRFTKGGMPWIKIHLEEYASRSEAMKREKYLKSGVGRKFLDSLVKLETN
ncbi:MAG TPA: GIY-YIG nuclease family protein [Ignavibacteriaceae bacterium]|nr:GIY-YIG nuclease family protein [Ignavibacteriaceae bacterium]